MNRRPRQGAWTIRHHDPQRDAPAAFPAERRPLPLRSRQAPRKTQDPGPDRLAVRIHDRCDDRGQQNCMIVMRRSRLVHEPLQMRPV